MGKAYFTNVSIVLTPAFQDFLSSLSDSPDLGPWLVSGFPTFYEAGVLSGRFERDGVEYTARFNQAFDRWELR